MSGTVVLEEKWPVLGRHVQAAGWLRVLGGARLNALHAVQRAVNALGFCAPPPATTGRGTARAGGGAQIWQQWVEPGTRPRH
nr:hypothetical protein [Rhodococcus wratislaviensis]GLK33698.1 hypothetical protein GCM10017611_05400 [Rhodococcus wratislaviensis]